MKLLASRPYAETVCPPDSPVETLRKELPQGNGDFPGYSRCYAIIRAVCQRLSESNLHLSDEHVRAMAILGCGHEETMKAEMMRLIYRGYARYTDWGE